MYSFWLSKAIPLWVTLSATFLSINVDIESKVSRVAISVSVPTGVRVYGEFHSEGWSAEAVIVFVVFGAIVGASSKWTTWGLALVSVVTFLTWIVRWGKTWMDEAVCSVNDYTVVSLEVQTYNWSCQFLHYDNLFWKTIVSNVKFKCSCCSPFF